VPTLVLHNTRDRWVEVERGRDLARRIPGPELVEFPIEGHMTPVADMPPVLEAIESFLHAAWESDLNREPDRQLATLLFTDSTTEMARLGDSGRRELLERHHSVVRRELARARGREIDTAGDGFFAAFDGPARAIRCAKSIVGEVSELRVKVRSESIPASASSSTERCRGSRYTPGLASRRMPVRAKSSSPARSRISLPAPGSSSRTAACTS
jgi:hypothetical protein